MEACRAGGPRVKPAVRRPRRRPPADLRVLPQRMRHQGRDSVLDSVIAQFELLQKGAARRGTTGPLSGPGGVRRGPHHESQVNIKSGTVPSHATRQDFAIDRVGSRGGRRMIFTLGLLGSNRQWTAVGAVALSSGWFIRCCGGGSHPAGHTGRSDRGQANPGAGSATAHATGSGKSRAACRCSWPKGGTGSSCAGQWPRKSSRDNSNGCSVPWKR